MKVLVAALADHAWVENGCLTVCRTIDSVASPSFPYQMPRMSIALRLLFGRSEVGVHKLSISLSDADGKKLLNAEVNINVSIVQESIPEASYSFALNGQNIVFPKEGDYVVNILINDHVESSIPLYVRKISPPSPTSK